MLQSLVKLSLEFRHLVLAAAILLVVAGGVLLPRAKVDVLPEFKAPMVEVQTEALGLSAGEVASLLSVPGVANVATNVAIWGQRARQLQVQIQPQRLQAAGVTLDEIIERAGEVLASQLDTRYSSDEQDGPCGNCPNRG